MFSTEFTIDEVPYLLTSNCVGAIWPKLCDRVYKELVRIGKDAAKHMYGNASAVGKTRMCGELQSFKLTINPKGNSFNGFS